MVKLVFLCRRRPDITAERYLELLRGHVPIALSHHPTMHGYVVNVVEQTPPQADELDSVGMLSFDSLKDFRERLYDSAEGRAVVERDTLGFLGAAHAYATTEHVRKTGPSVATPGTRSPGVKLFCALMRRNGTSHAEFVRHWLEGHLPLAIRHHRGLDRYVANVVDERLSPDGAPWDGFAELCFTGARPRAEPVHGPRGPGALRRAHRHVPRGRVRAEAPRLTGGRQLVPACAARYSISACSSSAVSQGRPRCANSPRICSIWIRHISRVMVPGA